MSTEQAQQTQQEVTLIQRISTIRRLDWWIFAVLAALTFLAYIPALSTGLLSDDWGLVFPQYSPWTAWHGHWFFGGHGSYYRPIARLVIFYTAAIFGTSGVASHLLSIFLHIGCGAWIFVGLKRLGRPTAGLIGSGIGMLHPAAVETVAWIASQTDLLVMFFFLGTLATAVGPLNPKRYVITAVFAILTYLSKDTSLLLGPSIVGACLYLLLFVRPLPAEKNRILTLLGIHAALWIVYLCARKIFLGSFFYETPSNPISQMVANLMAIINEFLWPIGRLFEERGFLHKETVPFFAGLLALPCLFFWCIASKRHIAAIAIALMCLGMGPYMKALDVTTWTGGGERFFYHPLWFFAILCGLLLQPAFEMAWKKRAYLGIGAIVALFAVRLAFQTGMELDDFRRAALVRDQIQGELEKSVLKAKNPIIIVERYPDRIGGAFVFRNGFRDFVELLADRKIEVLMVSDLTPEKLEPGMQVFRFNFKDEGVAPIIEFDPVMTRLAQGPQQDESGETRPAPYVMDFSDPAMRRMRFSLSPDLKFVQPNPDGSFRFEITGKDPHIGIPLTQNFDQRPYRTAFFEFALPDATENETRTDTFDLIFVPGKPDSAAVTLSQEVDITAQKQRFEADLSRSLAWRAAPGLSWIRFDPGSQYRGYIDIYRMGLE
ncbi:hypothetical protein KQI84_19270 [bacterium]|nr:hypothetical protein [bacterium]